MKVLHVSVDAERYGMGVFLYGLLEHFASLRPSVETAVAFHTAGPCFEQYRKLGIPLILSGVRSARDPRLFFRFLRLFRKYDIVHLHTYSPWAFLAAWISGVRLVYSFHGALGLRRRKRDPLIRLFHRWGINRLSDRVTFASEAARDKYKKEVGALPANRKMEIFPYGVSLRRIFAGRDRKDVRGELGLADRFLVGTCARLDPVKRIELVIEAVRRLPQPPDVCFLILGEGDEAYQRFLSNRVRQIGVEGRVRFMGYREDALDIVAALDAFVLASRGEAFGQALVEAMALGVPCVVFADGGGPVEILADSGLVVADSGELTAALDSLRRNEELRKDLGRKGRERAARFDVSATADTLVRVYQTCLSPR